MMPHTTEQAKMIAMTLPGGVELKLNKYQVKGKTTRRHALLPARKFVYDGHDAEVTIEMLHAMAANFTSGVIGPRRPVFVAHPQRPGEAKAVGWMLTGTAEVSAYKDGQAVYCDIEWTKDVEQEIRDHKWGFLSPVFAVEGFRDQDGRDPGPIITAAGITNDPHWTDQRELWEAFAAALPTTAHDADTKESEMELKEALAKISELEVSIAKLEKELDGAKGKQKEAETKMTKAETDIKEFTAKVQTAEAKVIEMTAAADTSKTDAEKVADAIKIDAKAKTDALENRIKGLETEAYATKVSAMVEKFVASGHLRQKHLEDKDLMAFAAKSPEQFAATVKHFEIVKLPESNQGGGDTSPQGDPRAAVAKRAAELADASDGKLSFTAAHLQAARELKTYEGEV